MTLLINLWDRDEDGPYGSVGLRFVVLSNAAQALVTVVLIDGDGESLANVSGTIFTNNGHSDSGIFDRQNAVDVRPNKEIPLMENAIAVPMNDSLSVTACLRD
jgi:hypothetical protein